MDPQCVSEIRLEGGRSRATVQVNVSPGVVHIDVHVGRSRTRSPSRVSHHESGDEDGPCPPKGKGKRPNSAMDFEDGEIVREAAAGGKGKH